MKRKLKEKTSFWHERCWICGGKFEDVDYMLNGPLGIAVKEPDGMLGSSRHYRLYECMTCGLAIFVRDKNYNYFI